MKTVFQNDIILASITPQATILRLTNEANHIYNLLNHILLVYKYYAHTSREKHKLNKDILVDKLTEIKKKEEQISLLSNNKMMHFKYCFTSDSIIYITKSILGGYEGKFYFVFLFCLYF